MAIVSTVSNGTVENDFLISPAEIIEAGCR
jgi:hypothetical protein